MHLRRTAFAKLARAAPVAALLSACVAYAALTGPQPMPLAHDQLLAYDEDNLGMDVAVHAIRPALVKTSWTLLEKSDPSSTNCPDTIVHNTYVRRPIRYGPIVVGHGAIVQDGTKCWSAGNNRRLELYESQYYTAELLPVDPADIGVNAAEIPQDLKDYMQNFNRNAKMLADNFNASVDFLFGYDNVSRFCPKGTLVFPDGTTTFVIRRSRSYTLDQLASTFLPKILYMIVIPKFRNVTCAYVEEGALPDPDPSDSLEPSPTPDVELPPQQVSPSPTDIGLPVVSASPSLSSSADPVGPKRRTPSPSASASMDMDGERNTQSATPSTTPDDMPDVSPPFSIDPSTSPETDGSDGDGGDTDSDSDSDGSGDADTSSSPEGDGAVCFPADAQVVLKDGATVAMSRLSVGTHVRTGRGRTAVVYGFSHRDARRRFQFVRMVTDTGVLEATAGHFVHTSEGLLPAGSVTTRMMLVRDDGSYAAVRRVDRTWKTGLYAPHTPHGDVVVNGFIASTFTTAVDRFTATALLAPLRAAAGLIAWAARSPSRSHVAHCDLVSYLLDDVNLRERTPWPAFLTRAQLRD